MVNVLCDPDDMQFRQIGNTAKDIIRMSYSKCIMLPEWHMPQLLNRRDEIVSISIFLTEGPCFRNIETFNET